jgi:putative endonuclease
MAYYIYILQSVKDGSFYVGSTQDVEARLRRHNQGRSKYTKAKRPWRVVHQETFATRSEATQREAEIKGKKRVSYLKDLVRTSRM